MNKKVNIDLNTLGYFYKRYRNYILPVSVIIVCIFLFFNIIISQFQNLSDLKAREEKEKNDLTALKKNFIFLNNLDENNLDENLQVANSALPADKDFAGILNSISSAANYAGVSVGEFEFQVGDIAKAQPGLTAFPSLQIIINVTGGINGARAFINKIYESVPLAEVTSVKLGVDVSSISMSFYYKPFIPTNTSPTNQIQPLSNKETDLLKKLSAWNESRTQNPFSSLDTSISSVSGENANPF